MDIGDIGKAIAKIGLPLLGSVLPIPGGAAIGSALASAIGSPSAKPEDILATLTQNAETLQKAKEFEATHQERLMDLAQQHELAMYKAEASDRDSARQREIAVKDRTPAHLAYMIIGGFFTVSIAQLVALLGWPDEIARVPPQGWVLIGNISGYLAAEAKAASAYFFGTTDGSARKTELLAQAPAIQTLEGKA